MIFFIEKKSIFVAPKRFIFRIFFLIFADVVVVVVIINIHINIITIFQISLVVADALKIGKSIKPHL